MVNVSCIYIRRIKTHHDHLDAFGCELLSTWLVDIASDAADFEFLREDWICEDGLDYGASLIARSAEDGENLRHDAIKGYTPLLISISG
jgi:hypothetical protein